MNSPKKKDHNPVIKRTMGVKMSPMRSNIRQIEFGELEKTAVAARVWCCQSPEEAGKCLRLPTYSLQHKSSRREVEQTRTRKLGHGRDASPDPRAMCCNFRLSAHCQVCRHQLLGIWKHCGRLGAAKRNQKFQGGKNENHKWWYLELMLAAAHQFFWKTEEFV